MDFTPCEACKSFRLKNSVVVISSDGKRAVVVEWSELVKAVTPSFPIPETRMVRFDGHGGIVIAGGSK